MNPEMRQALTERQNLIERRAAALLGTAITEQAPWLVQLGPKPAGPRKQAAWLKAARTIAAYRDRYQISDDPTPLEATPSTTKQRIDATRARSAFKRVRAIVDDGQAVESVQSAPAARSLPSL